jgi:hypothetical protein
MLLSGIELRPRHTTPGAISLEQEVQWFGYPCGLTYLSVGTKLMFTSGVHHSLYIGHL